MSGTRLLLTLLLELRRRGEKRGVASACIGGGQGIAAIVETRVIDRQTGRRQTAQSVKARRPETRLRSNRGHEPWRSRQLACWGAG